MPRNNLIGEPLLHEIYSKIVVEFQAQDAEKEEILSFIGKTLYKMDLKRIPKVKSVLNTLCDYVEFNIVEDGDMIRFVFDEDEEVSSSNKEKGGENMEKSFINKMTTGEEKVAKAVIDHFGNGFKIKKPSRMVFESCLKAAFPKIKNEKAATTNLINKGWLKENDGKISIGPEGEKYLSP